MFVDFIEWFANKLAYLDSLLLLVGTLVLAKRMPDIWSVSMVAAAVTMLLCVGAMVSIDREMLEASMTRHSIEDLRRQLLVVGYVNRFAHVGFGVGLIVFAVRLPKAHRELN